MRFPPWALAISRHLFTGFDQNEIAYTYLGVFNREHNFVVVAIKSDHIGHYFLRFYQSFQSTLRRLYGSFFQVITQEYKCNDSGSGLIKKIGWSKVQYGTGKTINECSCRT